MSKADAEEIARVEYERDQYKDLADNSQQSLTQLKGRLERDLASKDIVLKRFEEENAFLKKQLEDKTAAATKIIRGAQERQIQAENETKELRAEFEKSTDEINAAREEIKRALAGKDAQIEILTRALDAEKIKVKNLSDDVADTVALETTIEIMLEHREQLLAEYDNLSREHAETLSTRDLKIQSLEAQIEQFKNTMPGDDNGVDLASEVRRTPRRQSRYGHLSRRSSESFGRRRSLSLDGAGSHRNSMAIVSSLIDEDSDNEPVKEEPSPEQYLSSTLRSQISGPCLANEEAFELEHPKPEQEADATQCRSRKSFMGTLDQANNKQAKELPAVRIIGTPEAVLKTNEHFHGSQPKMSNLLGLKLHEGKVLSNSPVTFAIAILIAFFWIYVAADYAWLSVRRQDLLLSNELGWDTVMDVERVGSSVFVRSTQPLWNWLSELVHGTEPILVLG